MMRRSLDILAVLSALLCVAAAGMWVRSYWAEDMYRRADAPRDPATATVTQLASHSGTFFFSRLATTYLGPNPAAAARILRQYRPGLTSRPATPTPGVSGLLPGAMTFTSQYLNYRSNDFIAVVPYWMIVVILMALPGWRGIRFARRRRPPGVCGSCGYDLRASRQSGRCPECGKAFAVNG
jgi:hypothetical protein